MVCVLKKRASINGSVGAARPRRSRSLGDAMLCQPDNLAGPAAVAGCLDDTQTFYRIVRIHWGRLALSGCFLEEFVEALVAAGKRLNRTIHMQPANLRRETPPGFAWFGAPIRGYRPVAGAQSVFLRV